MADEAPPPVNVEIGDDHVAVVELRRGPANYFDVELIGAIADAYEALEHEPRCRAILLCAEGRHFCAGARFAADDPRAPFDPAVLYAAAARLVMGTVPVVAAVQGKAVGGGLGLACTADLRVATPATTLSANFARLGIHHGFGLTSTLPAIVGPQRARWLLLTAGELTGGDALAWGLCDVLSDPAALRETARQLAAEVAARAPLAVRSIKATLDQGRRAAFVDATARELDQQRGQFSSDDFKEGVAAAAARRAPRFFAR